ncbi:MAG: DUF2333 family protein [Pseudomonadota bacterium]|nr:DUF2333 family protein [Pseudomonadota bacterium]
MANRLLVIVVVLLLLPLLYGIAGQYTGHVNNTPLPNTPAKSSSAIVNALARMMERELATGFCPSSYFWPGHIRYDICGFQEGEEQIWQRVAMQLSDHLAREGSNSERDPDLSVVLANINRPNTWSLLFASNNTASLFKVAVQKLDQFDDRLRDQKAGFYPRIDNLSSLIGDITSLLGSESQQLNEKAAKSGLYSMAARHAYFHTLGTMAASCWILQAARSDFEDVLKMQSAEAIFDQALQTTCEKLNKNPSIVINGDDLSHLLTLSGSAAAAVNNLASLQTAVAAAAHPQR